MAELISSKNMNIATLSRREVYLLVTNREKYHHILELVLDLECSLQSWYLQTSRDISHNHLFYEHKNSIQSIQ